MVLAGILVLTTLIPATTASAQSSGERSLYLYYTHTKETARIVFKRNGRYVQSGLDQLNVFLRDWRRNEPAKMDPALFDLLWEVYQESGATQPIHIVSAYRSPATNAMLASNSSGVAENSQHMSGKAIDFFIPGIPVAKLREIGFRKQIGGVGYYPSSGSPFVHLDTGSVRAWPRMTTAQLQQIFPDGRTLHIPSNGVLLSQEGYRQAQAEWQRCHRVPCNAGPSMAPGSTQVAEDTSGAPRRTLLDFFTGGNSNSSAAQPAPTAVAAAPATRPVTSVPVAAPVQQVALAAPTPPARPGTLAAGAPAVAAAPQNVPFAIVDADEIGLQVAAVEAPVADIAAPVPPSMSRALADLRATTPSAYAPGNAGTLAIAAMDEGPVPLPRPQFDPAVVATAYAPSGNVTTRVDSAAATQTASLPPIRPAIPATAPQAVIDADTIETASFAPQMGLESFADLFSGPILPRDGLPDEATANALASLKAREGELFAPDLDHVTDIFLAPAALSSEHFAFLTDPDNADFNPATELGNDAHRYQFSQTASLGLGATGFGTSDTIWVRLQ